MLHLVFVQFQFSSYYYAPGTNRYRHMVYYTCYIEEQNKRFPLLQINKVFVDILKWTIS